MLSRVSDYLAVSPRDLLAGIHEPVLFLGDGVPAYGEELRAECGQEATLAPLECNYPRSSVLCRLAMEKYAREGGTHPRDLKALYVRASDAELNRKAQEAVGKGPPAAWRSS